MSTLWSGAAARRSAHAVVAVAVAAVTLQAAPASAAPAAPEITGPSGQTGPSVELSWQPVEAATGYEVRVDNDSAFGSPEWVASTVNTVSVPTKLLAKGQQYMQVRAKDAGGAWSDWSSSSFAIGTIAGPTLTGPVDGEELAQPANPPLLTWSPVAGSATYTVEVDTETGFVSPATYTTKGTSLVVPDNQAPGVEYVWRVRADLGDGYSTEYSDVRSYTVLPIAQPAILSPGSDEDITDVVLDWTPVAGAKYYELEVDDDVSFGSPEIVPDKIFGTKFSPKTTFGNDQYFWRVRAIDLDDNPTAWVRLGDDNYSFDRVWRDVPTPIHPVEEAGDPAPAGNDFYYEWSPVPHASHYELWLSTDPNFTEPTTATVQCLVAGTTYTPGELAPVDQCMPGSEGTVYYWKVRPMDLPYAGGGVAGIFSETHRFIYRDQQAITIVSPASNATVSVPTLDWEPVPGTETYEVSLYRGNGTLVTLKSTHSTSFTPMGVTMKPEEGPYRYFLRALDAAGRTSETVQRTFNLSDVLDTTAPLQPISAPATYDAPNLRWGAVDGAVSYRIEIGNVLTGNLYAASYAPILSEKLPFPAATDLSTAFLATGTYRWRASAFDKDGLPLGTGPFGTFEISPLAPVTGQRLALTGSALDAGRACAKTLSDGADQLCDNVPATPVLDWEPLAYASEYRVHVSRDGDFTTGALDPTPPRTTNTRWAPTFTYPVKALAESQAQTPYFWFIQPCKSATQCGPDPSSTVNPARHAFRKTSPKVSLQKPLSDAVMTGTEVTFEWTDYFDTNQATTYAATDEAGYQSGMRYQLQVDDEPTFASTLDDVLVDQPTYTAFDRFYPEGPLYWRVQAIDVQGNALGWTAPRTFTKTSPAPVLTSPIADGTTVPVVSGTVPFRWESQPFASGYEIQVAANADRNFSAANLKVTTTVKKSAFTTGSTVFPSVATLQASDTSYVWRVRRVDTYTRKGPWSAVGEFKVTLVQPTLLAPDSGATVGPRAVVLRWGASSDAAKYRVELRKVGTAGVTTTTTPATAWAPTATMTIGSTYEWRVATVDVDNRFVDPGPWRAFTIGGVPSATTPVTISGTGVYDTTLTATPPSWSVPGVTTTYQWRRNGAVIPGATGTTYVVRAEDVGTSLTVAATGASSEFGTGTSTSASVLGKAAPGPVATSAPEIAGTGKVGTTLTSTAPTWDMAGTTTTLQWMRNGSAISGATSATYDVIAGDVNASITLRATGTLPGRAPTQSLSNAITASEGTAATASTPPSIEGTPKVGVTITSTAPTWDQQGVQQTIQWLRGGQPISGQTTSSYTVRPEDVDASLTVRYTGILPGRGNAVVTSAPVTGLLGDAPQATTAPVVTGSRKVGTVLTTSAPTWNLSGVQQTVEWLRDGQPISGQTTSTYTVRPEDVDKSLSVRYSGTLPGRAVGTTTSNAMTGLLGDAPQASSPTVSGTRKVGTTLISSTPSWSVAGVVATIEWLRDGQPVAGETGATYTVRPEDVGAQLAVRWTGTAPGRAVGTTTSTSAAGLLGDQPTAPALAAPSGSGVVGTTLEAGTPNWSLSSVDQTRQWLLDGQTIAGETGSSYVVRASDVGRRISVRVTATKPGYAPGSVTSASVLAVAPAPTPTPTTPTPTPTPTTPTPSPTVVASKTVLKAPRSVKVGKRATVTITVTASGVPSPLGVVKVYAGKKLVGTVTLTAASKGLAKVRLAKLAAGSYKLTAKFAPSAGAKASTSKAVTLKVVR